MTYRDSEYYLNLFDYDVLFMDLNTPLYIFVVVLIVMACLHKLLFQPILRTLDNRKAHVDALHQRTRRHQAEIEALTQTYEERLEQVRAQVNQLRQDARRDAQAVVNGILERGRAEVEAELRTAMEELEGQIALIRTDLQQRAPGLADAAATQVLGA